MTPRNLRHRLEKAAKILVTIQKHIPDADCEFDASKGEHGHIQLSFVDKPVSPKAFVKLGKDLENKNYNFTEKLFPWIGQISYKGKNHEMPSVVMTMPHTQNRMDISQESPTRAYSFSD